MPNGGGAIRRCDIDVGCATLIIQVVPDDVCVLHARKLYNERQLLSTVFLMLDETLESVDLWVASSGSRWKKCENTGANQLRPNSHRNLTCTAAV